jgi:hypothetical protein
VDLLRTCRTKEDGGWLLPRARRRSQGLRFSILPLLFCTLVTAESSCAHSREPRDAAGEADESGRRADREERNTVHTTTGTARPDSGAYGDPDAATPGADPGENFPRRAASQRVVEEGKGFLIAGRESEAHQRFQQAIQLDGSNGVAYLYLAQISANRRDWSDAEGYHARATVLLAGKEEYQEPLDELARRIAQHR